MSYYEKSFIDKFELCPWATVERLLPSCDVWQAQIRAEEDSTSTILADPLTSFRYALQLRTSLKERGLVLGSDDDDEDSH
jgi:hypothetical protein